jgi:hypothetical protein
LEQKNAGLKRKLANYNVKQQDKRMSFKRDLERDIDEVGEALRNFNIEKRR